MAAKKSIGIDKVLLGLAALVAIGLIVLVVMNAGSLKENFETSSGSQKKAPPIKTQPRVARAIGSMDKAPVWKPHTTEGGRVVDLLVGIPWYIKKDGGEVVDILEEGGEPVHEGIDNLWWHKNNLDLSWSDSPERDPDVDGFSNREEYEAGTDPNNPDSFPAVIDKLELVKLEKFPFLITFSSDAGETFQFRYKDTYTGRIREFRTDYLPPGDANTSVFFADGPASLRFRLLEVADKDVKNERTGTVSKQKFAKIEDLSDNKKGDTFEVQKGSRNALIRRDFESRLILNAAGAQGQEFKVKERENFSLPFDPEAADKPYSFKEVIDGNTVIIAHQEGEKTTLYQLTEGNEIKPYNAE